MVRSHVYVAKRCEMINSPNPYWKQSRIVLNERNIFFDMNLYITANGNIG